MTHISTLYDIARFGPLLLDFTQKDLISLRDIVSTYETLLLTTAIRRWAAQLTISCLIPSCPLLLITQGILAQGLVVVT